MATPPTLPGILILRVTTPAQDFSELVDPDLDPKTLPGITILRMTTDTHIAALKRLSRQRHPNRGAESSKSTTPWPQPIDAATGMIINTEFGKPEPFPAVTGCNRQLLGYVRDYMRTYGDNFPPVIQQGCREAYGGMARKKSQLLQTMDRLLEFHKIKRDLRIAEDMLQYRQVQGNQGAELLAHSNAGMDLDKKKVERDDALRKNAEALNYLTIAMGMIEAMFAQLGLSLSDEKNNL